MFFFKINKIIFRVKLDIITFVAGYYLINLRLICNKTISS